MSDSEKVLFSPGDVVKLNKDLDFSPKMLVLGRSYTEGYDKETRETQKRFEGIRCGWFTKDYQWVTASFNFKDLEFV